MEINFRSFAEKPIRFRSENPRRRWFRFKHATTFILIMVITIVTVVPSLAHASFSSPNLLGLHGRMKEPIQKDTNRLSKSPFFAVATLSNAIIASVPPPGSKLYHVRHFKNIINHGLQMQPSIVSRHKRSVQTDLRYATHTSSSSFCSTSEGKSDTSLPRQSRSSFEQENTTKESNHSQHHDLNYFLQESNINYTHHSQTVDCLQQKTFSLQRQSNGKKQIITFSRMNLSRLKLKKRSSRKSHCQSIYLPYNSSPRLDDKADYEKRKAAWAAKYTSVSTLRSTFGSNKNRIWGDFDPTTTRKLYHTLIPRALLALHHMGLSDVDELAPLAYQARMAAKKYARERSRLPGRIGSMIYDGYRQWRRYGKWAFDGMTWEQIWDKYETQILREMMGKSSREEIKKAEEKGFQQFFQHSKIGSYDLANNLDEEDLTTKICLRILERSVVTNEVVDQIFLKKKVWDRDVVVNYGDENADVDMQLNVTSSKGKLRKKQQRDRRKNQGIQSDLRMIERKFDDDIRELLRHGSSTSNDLDLMQKSPNSGPFLWTQNHEQF